MLLTACSQRSELGSIQDSPGQQQTMISEATTTPFLPKDEPVLKRLQFFVPEGYKMLFTEWIGDIDHQQVNTPNGVCRFGLDFNGEPNVDWILALVAPFNTITDELDSKSLDNYLLNNEDLPLPFTKVVMPPNVLVVLEEKLGQKLNQVIVVNQPEISEYLYANPQTLAIIPFDQLTPAMKVLRIGQVSPYDQSFNSADYDLSIRLGFTCPLENEDILPLNLPVWTNRKAEKFTSVLITGTTALTRAIGNKMEIHGNQYPGEKIKMWFENADISHISNEVSYYEGCAPADPYQSDLLFCGRPEYSELFTYLGVDVIELTGNHLADKGVQPLIDMITMFDSQGIAYYAAGLDSAEAAKPLYLENNGNRIAFLGCNDAGPLFVYATDYRAGVNQCDMEEMAAQVKQVKEEGYLPIVTFQYWESFQFEPMPYQRSDFRTMIENGAVIVSGSQAHLPMTMEVFQHGFIHYGLGNLFFDQMDVPVVGTRREFLDRHIFYDGRYLGVDLLTAMLEDYSQPRPMTIEERQNLLTDAFVNFILQP